jgi:hypothetical protein
MLHTWDQQIMRLRNRVDELEEQNTQLSDLLTDTIRILAVGEAEGGARNLNSEEKTGERRITLGCDAIQGPARR